MTSVTQVLLSSVNFVEVTQLLKDKLKWTELKKLLKNCNSNYVLTS